VKSPWCRAGLVLAGLWCAFAALVLVVVFVFPPRDPNYGLLLVYPLVASPVLLTGLLLIGTGAWLARDRLDRDRPDPVRAPFLGILGLAVMGLALLFHAFIPVTVLLSQRAHFWSAGYWRLAWHILTGTGGSYCFWLGAILAGIGWWRRPGAARP